MNCRAFAERLEAYVDGRLAPAERAAAMTHLAGCQECRQLAQLARIAGGQDDVTIPQPPDDLTARVLARTAGSACVAAERRLCDLVDDRLGPQDAELVRGHLAGCTECAALTRALERLTHELPDLAYIRPDREFVAAVLAATLPWSLRVRRWWQRTWPRWIRRPRFAMEAAYVATILLVVIFTTPVSPLEAMPRRAATIVQTVPAPEIGGEWQRLEARVASALDGVRRSEGVAAVVGGWRETIELGRQQIGRARDGVESAPDWTRERFRTFWDWLASLLEKAEQDPEAADSKPDEETS